ncbi:hypothetical protein [Rhizobium sp. BK176]|uniref:hypothetical protein n=1 Tax=Rhizobium sp. BK176 TaxID=2587071 RepID=UPI0021696A08|nr:hypothetical protein [Rhizobium sp. BK176]MCS4090130.1 hypothetical protein [Rhizobium sp. BK176]
MAFEEAEITINGVKLDDRQSMALRVAVTNFHADNADPDRLGKDDHGRSMTKHYRDRCADILSMIFKEKVG